MPSESQPLRLLVADDDLAVMDALCWALRIRGHEVTGASDANAALAEIGADRFDVLIADLTMPGMSGVELLREARRRDPSLVGVIMSGASLAATAAAAAEAGAAGFVLKPVVLKDLLPVLSQALAKRAERQG